MLDTLKQRLRQHEGVIPNFYLDTKGFVTCGVGHLVSSPLAAERIPMIHPDGTPASEQEKAAEWISTKALAPGKLPPYYAAHTKLRITSSAIDELQDEDIAVFHAALRRSFSGFDGFPESAQEALLDMAFQLGAGGLVARFPRLTRAAKAQDWATCAAECHREGIQQWRNDATRDLFLEAAQRTAT